MKWGGTGKYKGITGKNSWRGCSRAKDACISGTGGMSWGRSGANTGNPPDRAQHLPAMTNGYTKPIKVLICQLR
jgi:hypothetical protein